MTQKHKHCEVIKAWAEGAKIQSRFDADDFWTDIISPTWEEHMQYRVKPKEKKKYYKYAYKNNAGNDCISRYKYVSDSSFVDECAITPKFYTRLDWTMEEREVND